MVFATSRRYLHLSFLLVGFGGCQGFVGRVLVGGGMLGVDCGSVSVDLEVVFLCLVDMVSSRLLYLLGHNCDHNPVI